MNTITTDASAGVSIGRVLLKFSMIVMADQEELFIPMDVLSTMGTMMWTNDCFWQTIEVTMLVISTIHVDDYLRSVSQ